MEVGAIADVLEDVFGLDKRCFAHPPRTFSSHLGVASGVPVHPLRHEMAADASQRTTALGHLGPGAMRTARAEIWRTVHRRLLRHAAFQRPLVCNTCGELRIGVALDNAVANRDGDMVWVKRAAAVE